MSKWVEAIPTRTNIHRGVVRCGDAMMYSIFLQQCTKVCIIEVQASMTDDDPRTYISGEDVPRDKFEQMGKLK